MARGGFPGMPGGNMQQMLKQAQRMQANIAKLQEELEAREYAASAGSPSRSSPRRSIPTMWKCFRIWCWRRSTRCCARWKRLLLPKWARSPAG